MSFGMARTLIVFDVDGTLTDSTRVDADCYVAALEEALGLRLDSTDWSQFENCSDAGIAAEAFADARGRRIWEDELLRLHDCFVERLRRALVRRPCDEIAGADELLRRLHADARFAMCLATGGWERSARLKLAAAGLDVAGLAFASSNDAHNRGEIIRTAVQRARRLSAGETFDACVAVGDGAWDAVTAAQLEIPFIGIARAEQAGRLRDLGAKAIFEDLRDGDAFIATVLEIAGRCPAELLS
jgi:phosphoglycolate phosphatase-like HAD superfamily hydrolase